MTNDLVSTKYTFACDPDECDVLIELTSSDGFGFPSGVMEITCPCGRKPTLLSVEHATIQPTNQTKEEKMDTTIGSDAFHSNRFTICGDGYSLPSMITDVGCHVNPIVSISNIL